MKQVLQNLRNGTIEVADLPSPRLRAGNMLIRSTCSLVSLGTERMLVEFGKANFIEKARQQPDKVRMVLDKVRTDGLLPALDAVRDKLDQPLALGYCNVGRVMEVGSGVNIFSAGDRVASNGRHAEVVDVPMNLCARVPGTVNDEHAAFTTLGAVALQGIRLAQPTLGEAIVVTGLGLVGLLAVQLLRSHGCRVLGIDMDPHKVELAKRFGAETVDLSAGEDPIARADTFSRGRGVDAVIVTAATKSSEPMHQAAQMCRQRGRIILVGVTGLNFQRSDFYEKELTFQVSCSYGPGRYDSAYEESGQDYPVGFVRWTEQRNFEAVLDMMADKRLDVAPLITHRFSVDRADEAYALLVSDEPVLGILLDYPSGAAVSEASLRADTVRLQPSRPRQDGDITVSFLGVGNYASRVLVPAFRASGARLAGAASTGGVASFHAARKRGLNEITTDAQRVIDDPSSDAIVIATRHDSHARLVVAALKAGKHVFVEKPLCLGLEELGEIEAAYRSLHEPRLLMVGFNRRFAPHVRKMKDLLAGVSGPKAVVATINAGAVPQEHWSQDRSVGGGRLIGEACHHIDLLRYLIGAPIVDHRRDLMKSANGDTASMHFTFADGSIGTVHYFANGSRRFPKERLEIFCDGRVLQLDNFRVLRGFGWPAFRALRLWRQDKGQYGCVAAFVDAIRDGHEASIPFDDISEVSRVSILLGGP